MAAVLILSPERITMSDDIRKSKNVSKNNPFPGPRPFESDESKYFFGREREKLELTARILANRVVFLYAKSGAGKTSLLNACLLPSLATEEDFDVLPVVRLGNPLPNDIDPGAVENIFVFNALRALTNNADSKSLLSQRLPDFLFDDFIRKSLSLSEHENRPAPRVLVLDQFEEIFTTCPERWKDRKEFFVQLAAVLDPDPDEWKKRLELAGLPPDSIEPDRSLRVLFALREDHLANLHSYAEVLPVKPTVRVRIEQLRSAAACEAVEGPAKLTGKPFEKGVACELVTKLRETRVKVNGGVESVEGEFVEPVQLQIICKKLFETIPSTKQKIDFDDLAQLGDINEPLAEYYNAAIEQVVEETGEKESALRDWFEHSLITPAGTRGTAFLNSDSLNVAGIRTDAVGLFEDLYLVRGENRPGGVWYELTHDRFIEPILESNKKWRDRYKDENRQQLEDKATAWSNNDGELLNEAELKVAENWLTTPQALELGYSQTLFVYIKASRAEVDRKRLEEKIRTTVRLRQFAAALAVLFVIALGAAGYAQYANKELQAQREAADKGKADAETARAQEVVAKNRAIEQSKQAEEAKEQAEEAKEQADKAKDQVEDTNELLEQANKRIQQEASLAQQKAKEAQEAKVRLDAELEESKGLRNTALEAAARATASEKEAKAALREAEKQRVRAEQLAKISEARKLAAESRAETEDSFNSVVRALLAINQTSGDGLTVKEAIDALHDGLPGALLEMPPLFTNYRIISASFTGNGSSFITVGANGELLRWDLSTGKWEQLDFDLDEEIGSSSLSADGKILAVSTSAEPKDSSGKRTESAKEEGLSRNVKLINLESNKEMIILGRRRGVLRLGLDSSGDYLASSNTFGNYGVNNINIGGKSNRIWDKPDFSEKIQVRIFHMPFRLANAFAFSRPAGNKDPLLLATGFQNGEVLVRNAITGDRYARLPAFGKNGHRDSILAMAFDPHGTSLVTSSRDDTVKLWSLSPESLQREKKMATFVTDLSAENKYGGNDYRYPYHDNPVTSISFNSQGELMATGSEDGTVWIWQVNRVSNNYEPIVRLPNHTKQVSSVTFSADGKRLASIAADNNVRIWDMSLLTEYLAVRKEVDRIWEANQSSPGVSKNAEALGIPELVQKLELFLEHHSNNRATLKRR